VVESAQAISAASAGVYLDDIMEAYGRPSASEGRVRVDGFAGVASDGRPLDSLLYQPAISALTAIQRGATERRALAVGRFTAELIVRTQVADAGRVADGVALAARPELTGWVRMLSLPSCSRCILLAGRWYRYDAGFPRHPACLPAGVVVSTPGVQAATRRWYEGELVVIRTASGQELPVTGNHPVLTDRGWVPANFLQEGDHVARSVASHVVPASGADIAVPYEDQVPTRIEDLWRAYSVLPLRRVPTSPEDFHGDGGYGQVDVVAADGFLRDRLFAGLTEPSGELPLIVGDRLVERVLRGGRFAAQRAANELFLVSDYASQGSAESFTPFGRPRSFGDCGHAGASALGSLSGYPQLSSVGRRADFYAGSTKAHLNRSSSHPVPPGNRGGALAGPVLGDDLLGRQRPLLQRWDAPAVPLSVESRPAYAERGRDLLNRLAGQVELDRIVHVQRSAWSGHVYNLSSIEGWYSAANIILSNCDCTAVPAPEDDPDDIRTDPMAAFRSMDPAQQDRVFTRAGAQAIRDGADIFQVVNARRGISTAAAPATVKTLRTTRTGTTRRALAGRRLQGRSRLLPEEIYRQADGDRDVALQMLRRHGYLF
jgi:hypothetical protein